jgi:hypothetical protein
MSGSERVVEDDEAVKEPALLPVAFGKVVVGFELGTAAVVVAAVVVLLVVVLLVVVLLVVVLLVVELVVVELVVVALAVLLVVAEGDR